MKKLSHFLKTPEGMFLAGVGLVIAALLVYYASSSQGGAVTEGNGSPVISQTDHVRGAKDGKVTLVEFGDFQCPACGAYEPLVKQVLTDNKDILTFSFRHFPLTQIHRNALLAAKASEAAGLQGKFWEMHDMLYDKQEEWSGLLNAKDVILMYATTLDLDTKKFIADLESKALEDKILAEFKEGVQLGVKGTPTFFVNGKKLDTNPQDLASFNKLIKEAAKATQ